jgi:hypothetical protein
MLNRRNCWSLLGAKVAFPTNPVEKRSALGPTKDEPEKGTSGFGRVYGVRSIAELAGCTVSQGGEAATRKGAICH